MEPMAPFKALAGLAVMVPLPLDRCTEEIQKLGHIPADQEGSEGRLALSSHVLYPFCKYTEDFGPSAANSTPFPSAKILMEGFKSNAGVQGRAWIPFT